MDDFLDTNERGATQTERRMLASFEDVFLAEEPIPDDLITLAQDCYTWRTVDAELLDLLIDSAETELAVVRDDDRLQRFVAFGNDEHGVHFECSPAPDGFTITGIIVPAGTYDVRVDRAGDGDETTTDELGAFIVGPLAPGSIRLTVTSVEAPAHTMITPWFTLLA